MIAKVEALLRQANAAGNTPEGVALAESAVREADASENIESGYNARNQLIRMSVFSGYYEKAVVAFSWCLAKVDERPDQFPVSQFLWNYKWVVNKIVHFPGISRAQLDASLSDFRDRCLKNGYNERAALFLRWACEMLTGNLPAAEEYRAHWKRTKRDGMSDCRACELNQEVELEATLGHHERAIRAARPILDGSRRCAEIPHVTYASLLRSFWLAGQRDAAEEYHRKGYRLVRSNRDFIREQAWHLAHLLRCEQLEPAAALVRKHLPWALETKSLDYRFYFLIPARVCVERLLNSGLTSLRCRLPVDVCPIARKASVSLKELLVWMDTSISDLANQFDARNGNQFFATIARQDAIELGAKPAI